MGTNFLSRHANFQPDSGKRKPKQGKKMNITSQHTPSYQPTKLKRILFSEKTAGGTLLQAVVA
jgi:nucleoid DNA-binding protein